jgi:hypothetical protein
MLACLVPIWCYAALPIGSFDVGTPSLIAGWAKDPDFDGAIICHVYVDSQLVKVLLANKTRSDIGSHAFNWIPPPFGPKSHSIVVYAIGVDATGRPDGENPSLAHSPRNFTAGCEGIAGDALAWCKGVVPYWQNRQRDVVMVGNNNVRAAVNMAYGGAIFQLYDSDWQTNLLDEHGGAANQLSIWGYEDKGPSAWFRKPSPPGNPPAACDPTPYQTQDACINGSNTTECVVRCCSQGSHVADCKTVKPCGGWTAGAPWNPIQAQGSDCGWGRDRGSNNATWNWESENGSASASGGGGNRNSTGSVLHTTVPQGYHFTKNGPSTPLQMEQWISAGDTADPQAPYLEMRYRLRYEEGPVWGATTQEIPAIFTAHGMTGKYYYALDGGGGAVTVHDGSPKSFARFPNRSSYPHPEYIGTLAESWWGVCDAAGASCVTGACFDELCVEASLSDNGSGSGYITPIGLFGISPANPIQWTVYLFPYRWDAVVAGKSIRDWIQQLQSEHRHADRAPVPGPATIDIAVSAGPRPLLRP